MGTSFILVLVHATINVNWFSAMVLLLARLARAARSSTVKRWLKGVTGVVFIGFSAKLATLRP